MQSHPAVGVESTPTTPPPFYVEVEASVFRKLTSLADKEGIGISELASALIKYLLLIHRAEVKRLIDELKRRNHQCHAC